MSYHEFEMWVEIPIKVGFEYQPKEPSEWAYPGCPEGIEIEGITLQDDLTQHILKEYKTEIEDAVWEQARELKNEV